MGRSYKCKGCGCKTPPGVFYKHEHVTSGGNKQNQYFCSKEEFDEIQIQKEFRTKVLAMLHNNILNYDDKQLIPHTLVGDMSKLGKSYGWDVLLKCIEDCLDPLSYWMGLDGKFTNEHGRCRYISAVISNNINDTYIAFKRDKNNKVIEETNTIEIDMMDIEVVSKRKPKSDISSFLD